MTPHALQPHPVGPEARRLHSLKRPVLLNHRKDTPPLGAHSTSKTTEPTLKACTTCT